jgi:fructose-1,6-bisphosphatase/inositol monophosphatase family enzyme
MFADAPISLETIEFAAIKGAEVVLSAIKTREINTDNYSLTCWKKSDKSLVSSLDIDSEKVIISLLESHIPCISEERDGVANFKVPSDWWISVDPIDGTTSCVRNLTTRNGQIGFGPLLGLFHGDKLYASVFAHIPERTLFTATLGAGAWATPLPDLGEERSQILPLSERLPLKPPTISRNSSKVLSDCAMLGYFGSRIDAEILGALRETKSIQTFYRFGGLANDCVRVARGDEDIAFQLQIKPWDFPSILFLHESDHEVVLDPLKTKIPFVDWGVKANNPMIATDKSLISELLSKIKDLSSESFLHTL